MRRSIAAFLCSVIVATACTQGPPQSGQPSPGGGDGTPQRGGRVVQGITFEITGLQPLHSADASEVVWSHFYPRIMVNDPDTGDLAPHLAEKYELSADGKTLTFTLRQGVTWSDGVPFTGEDYKYSVEATARSPKAFRKAPFRNIIGFQEYVEGKADTISGLTVSGEGGRIITIKLANVFCPAPRLLASAGGGVLPKHHFIKDWNNKTTDTSTNIDKSALNDKPPASVGPFVLKEWRKGVEVVLARNEKYFKGAPLIDEYIIKSYADDAAVKAAMLSGEVHFGAVSATDVEEFKKSGRGLQFHRAPRPTTYQFIGWNMTSPKAPWLGVKEVRQALWHGLNVKQIVDRVMLGYAKQIYTHNPPQSWAYDPGGLKTYDYNVQTAKQMLERAGATMGPDGIYRWKDGQRMKMRIEAGAGESAGASPAGRILAIAQEQYKQVGIEIEPVIQSIQTTFERNDPTFNDREGTLGSWSISPDPDGMFIFFHSANQKKNNFNWFHYENPKVDELIMKGRNGPDCSNAARRQAYVEAAKILNEDAPYTWLFQPEQLAIASEKLQNFVVKPYGISTSGETWEWNAEKWWLKK